MNPGSPGSDESVVGSTNLDFRSFLFNAECDLVMLDAEVARRMEEAFEEDLHSAVEIHRTLWRRRPALKKLGDRLACMMAPVL